MSCGRVPPPSRWVTDAIIRDRAMDERVVGFEHQASTGE